MAKDKQTKAERLMQSGQQMMMAGRDLMWAAKDMMMNKAGDMAPASIAITGAKKRRTKTKKARKK